MECISKVSNNIIKIVKIRAYKYQELDSKGKAKVIYQMNEIPFDSEFENDNGELITEYDYFGDWDLSDQIDFCDINEYLFDRYGNPIHHLIEGS